MTFLCGAMRQNRDAGSNRYDIIDARLVQRCAFAGSRDRHGAERSHPDHGSVRDAGFNCGADTRPREASVPPRAARTAAMRQLAVIDNQGAHRCFRGGASSRSAAEVAWSRLRPRSPTIVRATRSLPRMVKASGEPEGACWPCEPDQALQGGDAQVANSKALM